MKQLGLFSVSKMSENAKNTYTSKDWCLYTDGAARNNPGPAGVGFVLLHKDAVVVQHGFYIGKATNNQAEYLALLLGLHVVSHYCKSGDRLLVKADSQLMIRQMQGMYKIKDSKLAAIKKMIDTYAQHCDIRFEHVMRAHNKKADELANYGINQKILPPQKILSHMRAVPVLCDLVS